jgi:hypothetical protein
MSEQSSTRQFGSAVLAIILWLITFGLGLQSIYIIKELYFLINGLLGGNIQQAESIALGLVFVLSVAFLVFIIASTEYHFKRVGRPESWRLFGWTLAVELSLLIIYYLL